VSDTPLTILQKYFVLLLISLDFSRHKSLTMQFVGVKLEGKNQFLKPTEKVETVNFCQ